MTIASPGRLRRSAAYMPAVRAMTTAIAMARIARGAVTERLEAINGEMAEP